jgi:hypothetical protein
MESATLPRDTAWAMSEENVEIAKRISEAGRRGDLEAALGFVAEDVVMTNLGWPLDAPRTVHGRDELAAYYAEVTRGVRRLRKAGRGMDRCRRLGDHRRELGRHREGKRCASRDGAEYQRRSVSQREAGRIEPDKKAALEAAGLRE